jgi:hypothetical protein
MVIDLISNLHLQYPIYIFSQPNDCVRTAMQNGPCHQSHLPERAWRKDELAGKVKCPNCQQPL